MNSLPISCKFVGEPMIIHCIFVLNQILFKTKKDDVN